MRSPSESRRLNVAGCESCGNGYTLEMDTNERRPAPKLEYEHLAAGDDAMEDELTEENQITPAQREDVAQTLELDP